MQTLYQVSGSELWQWRQTAQQQALAAEVEGEEVDWLLRELTKLGALELRLGSFRTAAAVELKLPFSEFTQLWTQRLQEQLPIQYVVGVAPWRRFLLQVTPAVLIPRPETELLIDLAVSAVQALNRDSNLDPEHWADVGTGSGAIALGLADAFPQAQIHAVDCSEAAIQVAQRNADRHNLSHIHFYTGSWLTPLTTLQGQLSGIVSNPPYIPTAEIPALQPEVARHEPHLALDGGADGLDAIRQLVTMAPDYLRSGGIWLIEMMQGQSEAVVQLLDKQGAYRDIQVYPDLAGIQRFVLAYRR